MSGTNSLEGIAIVDTPITSRVRVRSWRHRFGPTEFPPGAHPDVEVAWVVEGQAHYRIGARELRVDAGSAVVVPARTEHATRVCPGIVAASAWLAPDLVHDVAQSLGRRPEAEPYLASDAAEIAGIGALLESEARVTRAGQSLSVDALARALVVAVLRAAPGDARRRPARDARIAAALDLLEADFASPLGVDDLARAAGISRFHFCRLFRDATGESPYRYLQRIRLERAYELLTAGHGVTDAAFSVGFHDLSRFARAFRAQMGVSPSSLRQAARCG